MKKLLIPSVTTPQSMILFAKCYDVANNMLKESKPDVEIDTYSKDILGEIRTARISLDDLQKQEAKHLFGNNYQRYFIGRVIIAENGAKLDGKWQEWAERYPDIFDPEVNPNDQIGELYDILGRLQYASETVIEYNKEEKR